MQLTLKIKLQPTKMQTNLIKQTMNEYIKTVNNTVSQMVEANDYLKLSSKDILADLPSALRGQCVVDSKSIFKKYRKTKIQSILKKPVAIWNNQNFRIEENSISFPVWVEGTKRIKVKAYITPTQQETLQNKLGTLRITTINRKLIAQITIQVSESTCNGSVSMGVDLGLKIPAVAVTDNGKTKFFGNGRQNKYMKRKFRAKRKKLGKAKKQKAIDKLGHKEQRWMRDQDHKLSRQIVNFAKENNVSVIRMEKLQNIRNTARTSRKNEKNLHTWSFYSLAEYIEYKAKLAGIEIEYVNPAYTSQTCPCCGVKNHAKDRKYVCLCGYQSHRDRVGAINIIHAPVVVGNRQSA